MDARCYAGSKVRTKYKKLKLSWRDIVAFFVIAILLTVVIVLRVKTVALL
jgi:energy-coupling factor transporter transmembrane protein EcfT